MSWYREALKKWLRGCIAALRGARSLAYLFNMSRSLRCVRQLLHPARQFFQRLAKETLLAALPFPGLPSGRQRSRDRRRPTPRWWD